MIKNKQQKRNIGPQKANANYRTYKANIYKSKYSLKINSL